MNEIEEMAATIALYTPINCNPNKIATALVDAGYGDVKQAVSEFAERLKERLAQKEVNLYNSKSQVIQIDIQTSITIDELVKEVCGEWTN